MRRIGWVGVVVLAQGCGLLAGLGDFRDGTAQTGGGGTGATGGTSTSTSSTGGAGGTSSSSTGGADAGGFCGDGKVESPEECDTGELGQADCASLGFTGGTLACSVGCAYDTSGCTSVVSVPALRSPVNGAYVGTVHKAGSMKPTFVWEPSTTTPPVTVTYTLQYAPDPNFVLQLVEQQMSVTQFAAPADLPAQSAAIPYGTRYFWRVKACTPSMQCSAWSAVRRLSVGRSRHDYNGDGYADVLSGGVVGNGHVQLSYGQSGQTVSLTSDAAATGEASNDLFGSRISSAGDVNADGFADILVGAPTAVGGPGAAYLYLGGQGNPFSGGAALKLLTAQGQQNGLSVGGLGDVNGDGFDDFGTGKEFWGCAYVYFGGLSGVMDGTSDWSIIGRNIVGAGDVNGDGYDDVITGNGSAAGAARLYYGGPSVGGGACSGPPFVTGSGNDHLASSLASGDLNGDGFSDLAIGALDPATENGYVQIWFGGKAGPTMVATLPGVSGAGFGRSVAVGDVDGDGFADVVVGATADSGWGRVHVYKGAAGAVFATVAAGAIDEPGPAVGDLFGIVSAAGDVNGDGFTDIVVGAPGRSAAVSGGGATFLFLGAAGFPLALAGSIEGNTAGDQLGFAVASWAPGSRPTRRRAAQSERFGL